MTKLIPPDPMQCQAMKSNGVNFMTLGGKREMIRCENKPAYIATENQPAEDGLIGSMSVCSSCARELRKQKGADYCTLTPIKEES